MHGFQDEKARFAALEHGFFQYLEAYSFEFDVELERRDAGGRSGYFVVHVAVVVFDALDVGKYGVFAVLAGDQAHRNAGYGSFDRDACIHHGQGRSANRGHGGRSAGTHYLGNKTDCVREVRFRRDDRQKRPLGQCSVPNLSPSGGSHSFGFAGGEGGEVIVMHETLGIYYAQPVQLLFVPHTPEGRDGQRLGFTAGKKAGSVDTRQYPYFAGELA